MSLTESCETRVLTPVFDVIFSRRAHESERAQLGRENLFVARDLIKVHKQPTGRVVNELSAHLELRAVHGRGLADGCPVHGNFRVAVCGQYTPGSPLAAGGVLSARFAIQDGYLAVLKASQDVRQQDHGIRGDAGRGPVGLR